MRVTTSDLIKAGANCLKGECTAKVETEVNRQDLIAQIESTLDMIQERERPIRERRVQAFASRHGIEGAALDELVSWICDYREPPA
jgi:hypothetical protein